MQFEKDLADLEKFKATDPSQPGFYLLGDLELEPYKKLWLEPVSKIIEKRIGKDGRPLMELVKKNEQRVVRF